MTTVPIPAYPLDAEGFEHPSWCDLGECTAPSALRQRGVDEADLPSYMLDNHLSTPWVIDADRGGEAAFTLQAWRGSNQPVEDGVDGADLVADLITARNLRVGVMVSVAQLGPLARAFAGVRDTAAAGMPPTIVQRAVTALTAFGEHDADVVARLLPMWRQYGEMTPADVQAVIAWFTIGGEQEPARIPDPATARDLRALFDGHPLIDRLEAELREAGAADAVTAARWLPTWPDFGALTEREISAVLARFVPAPFCDDDWHYNIPTVGSCPTCKASGR